MIKRYTAIGQKTHFPLKLILTLGPLYPAGRLFIICAFLLGLNPFVMHGQGSRPEVETIEGNLFIVPKPGSMQVSDGHFTISAETRICLDRFYSFSFDPFAVFQDVLFKKAGYTLKIDELNAAAGDDSRILVIYTPRTDHLEGYSLSITPGAIIIRVAHEQGLFYAMQTLRQISRMDAMPDAADINRAWRLPAVEITDAPQFPYRGLHLDVCRHIMPLDFVKKYIDLLAYYKMNRFHWHLTDDQGWRIEIKQYPKLQEIAAWRNETLIGHYREYPDRYDGTRHGGYYTQDEIREVVAYAAERGVTIIPEIEMPGHAMAALSAYPELACTPGPFEAATTWGVFDDVFCPTEETFTFLENVLDEVITLFPSPYIHIGGDECPKVRWKESSFCQQLIHDHDLKDEHGLQSYFIRRIETYLNARGKNIIGWDEILEGGLAPNATVMSWRGFSGGIEAAQSGHDVIMTPGSYCYFDHYQDDPSIEPLAIGGLTRIEKVYAFNPVPDKLSAEEAKHIIGAQANLWTEYIDSPAKAEYMAYPRALALAEVLWTPVDQRQWPEFASRLNQHLERLDGLKVNYTRTLESPNVDILIRPEGLGLLWKTDIPNQSVHHARDSTQATWSESMSGDTTWFDTPGPVYYKTTSSATKKIDFNPSKAFHATIHSTLTPSASYPGRQGLICLQDGLEGKRDFNGEDWCGWSTGTPFTILLDFDRPVRCDSIRIGLLNSPGAWIYMPQEVGVEVISPAQPMSRQTVKANPNPDNGKNTMIINTHGIQAQSIRLKIVPLLMIPEGRAGAGKAPWTFIDEISVY